MFGSYCNQAEQVGAFYLVTFSLHAMQLHIEFISILLFVVVVFGSAAANSSLQTRHAELLSPPCGSESNYAGFALEKRLLSKQSLGGGLPDLYIPGLAAPVDSPAVTFPSMAATSRSARHFELVTDLFSLLGWFYWGKYF